MIWSLKFHLHVGDVDGEADNLLKFCSHKLRVEDWKLNNFTRTGFDGLTTSFFFNQKLIVWWFSVNWVLKW